MEMVRLRFRENDAAKKNGVGGGSLNTCQRRVHAPVVRQGVRLGVNADCLIALEDSGVGRARMEKRIIARPGTFKIVNSGSPFCWIVLLHQPANWHHLRAKGSRRRERMLSRRKKRPAENIRIFFSCQWFLSGFLLLNSQATSLPASVCESLLCRTNIRPTLTHHARCYKYSVT